MEAPVIPFPFEVIPAGDSFTWRIIGADGRPLVYTDKQYPSDFAAADAAKIARETFAQRAKMVDCE